MKILILLILSLSASSIVCQISDLIKSKESVALFKEIVTSDVAKEWGQKLGTQFTKIASASKMLAKFAGPYGEVINFVLATPEEAQNQTEEYLKNITSQLNKIDAKLDAISDQLTSLEAKLSQSTKKITSDIKFENFKKYSGELSSSKQQFEAIISSFVSDSPSLIKQLDKFVKHYRQQDSDIKLVEFLDSSAGFSKSIVDDLIDLSRSYHNDTSSSGTSTMKIVYETFISVFMAVVKGNLILESVVNIKTTITGQYYEEDRRYNHYRKNQIFKKFFLSFQKSFSKLNDNDMDGFIDFTINGNQNSVKMINVLQIFWENEDKLSIIDTCSDECEHFQNRKYSGGGCKGGVRDCKFAVSLHYTERYLRQNPQVDRIYDGYVLNKKWYGYGVDDESNPNMESKKSYLRGFVNCHVCKCVCDQYSNSDSVRKIYTGKVKAIDNYVIVGVRFIEKNKAIYPQIQVGKLLPLATIDQKSVKWQEVPNDNKFAELNYDRRTIDLGNSESYSFLDGAVTGVQFQLSYTGVSWSIYGRKIVDFNKGVMGNEDEIQSASSSGSLNAENLIPGLSSGKKFSTRNNIKVIFGISNEDNDAGQSFVPYFDGTNITFDISAPLSGISLIHYTNDVNYAGYIRPVLRSLNYRKLFKTAYEADEFIPDNSTKYVKPTKSGTVIIQGSACTFFLFWIFQAFLHFY